MTHSGGMDFPASKPPRESNRHCRPAIFGPCVDVVFQEEMDVVFSIARFSRNYTPTKPEALFVKVCHLTKVQEKNGEHVFFTPQPFFLTPNLFF